MTHLNTSLNLPSHVPAHYIVELEGTVWDKDTNGIKTSKGYNISIPIPLKATAEVYVKRYNADTQRYEEHKERQEVHINDYGIRSYLKKSGKLKEYLSKKLNADGTHEFVNITHVRTINIMNVVASHPGVELPTDPAALNLTQLKTLVQTMNWKIDLKFFNTAPFLREAIINYKEDPKGYEAYEMRMKRVKGKQSAFTTVSDELEKYYAGQQTTQRQLLQQTEQEEQSGVGEGTGRVKSLKLSDTNDNSDDEI